MNPVLFRIGDFAVGSYGMAIMLGLFAGLWMATHIAQQRQLSPEFFYDLIFVLLLSGFVGARLLFILQNWRGFLENPASYIFSRQGFVFLGGFALAIGVGIWFVRRRSMSLLEVADVIAPALALAHAFGRLGCFFAGCCYGKACPTGHDGGFCSLAVQFPLVHNDQGLPDPMFNFAYSAQIHHGFIPEYAALPLPVIPVQLFEAVGNLALCILLVLFWRRRTFPGQIFALYMGLYGILRFNLEYLRGDMERGVYFGGALSISQIISIFIVIAAVVLWWSCKGRGITPVR